MKTPRYVLGSVSGYPINDVDFSARALGSASKPPPTIWVVLDSAYCYRQIGEPFTRNNAEARARAFLEQVNAA